MIKVASCEKGYYYCLLPHYNISSQFYPDLFLEMEGGNEATNGSVVTLSPLGELREELFFKFFSQFLKIYLKTT